MQPHLKKDLLYCLRILEAVEKIQLYTSTYDEPVYFFEAGDGRDFDASLMMLTQIGEQAGLVSDELKNKYPSVDWRQIKGVRNRAVHDYTGLNQFLTFDIIKQQLPVLKVSLSQIVRMEVEQGGFAKEEYEIAKKASIFGTSILPL